MVNQKTYYIYYFGTHERDAYEKGRKLLKTVRRLKELIKS